jgi:PAS domain S-box-containing protein
LCVIAWIKRSRNVIGGIMKNTHRRSLLTLILIASILTAAFVVWEAWTARVEIATHFNEATTAAKISANAKSILYFDEVLTMSARMAAATGDTAWITRYQHNLPELDKSIAEAKALAALDQEQQSVTAIDIANVKLVNTETKSFNLVHQGRLKAAFTLLTGPRYMHWKQVYSTGVQDMLRGVEQRRKKEMVAQKRSLWILIVAHDSIGLFALVLWGLVARNVALTWRDIAARYQATADALMVSEKRYRALFESSRDAIMTARPATGKFTSGNPAALKLFGAKNEEEFLTIGPSEVSPQYQPNGRPSAAYAREMIATAMREGVQFFEWMHQRLDGTVFPAVVLLNPIELNGEAQVQSTVRDITAQKQAEEAINREAAKLSAMISGMEEGVVFASADNVIMEINGFMCRILGKTRDEVIGKNLDEVCHGEACEYIRQRISDFRTDQKSQCSPFQFSLGVIEAILRVQPIYREGLYDGIVLNIIDVTELVAARNRANTANIAKSAFLANMSHEIRTPMTAMLGFTDMLSQTIECYTTCSNHQEYAARQQSKEYLQIIKRNGEYLLGVINDILDLSKIEAGKIQIEQTTCSPIQLVEEVVSLMRVRALDKGLALNSRYDFPLPEAILSDPERIRQILMNLASNAVKFTAHGKIEIRVRCNPDMSSRQATLDFSVKDTGIGMSQEQLEKIFHPFMQADASTTRKYGGTGLGLSICKGLAEALGGAIEVESQLDHGSAFTFAMKTVLPETTRMLSDISDATLVSHKTPATTHTTKLSGKVLLAEDGEDNQKLIQAILKMAGAEVDVVENGQLTMEKALDAQSLGIAYDAILMDMQMPVMDGYEATRKLRQAGYTGVIIALTAHAMAEDRTKCLAAGCNEYATKPVDKVSLLRMLAKAMCCSQIEQEEPSCEATAPPADAGIASQFTDDPEMTEIIDEFVMRLPDTLVDMDTKLQNHDHPELRRLAHQLKGAGGGYGYPALTEKALCLENAAEGADETAEVLVLDELQTLVNAIIAGRKVNVN